MIKLFLKNLVKYEKIIKKSTCFLVKYDTIIKNLHVFWENMIKLLKIYIFWENMIKLLKINRFSGKIIKNLQYMFSSKIQ
jgi:hypothetical protein